MKKLEDIINKWSMHFATEPNLLDLRRELRKDINSYALEIANDALKIAADNAKVKYFVLGEKTDAGELTARVDKESILSIKIDL